MREKNFGDPPYPPKKAYFGRTKAKIGRFSQKGLCYSFGILHLVRAECVRQRNKVAIKLGIISLSSSLLSLSRRLLKTIEGVS